MPIINWPSHERPREKLLNHGAAILSDAELIAIILRTGSRGVTALDLARLLLTQFGSLRGLLRASRQELFQQRGLGPTKYVQLQAILEIARRCLLEPLQQQNVLKNPRETIQYIAAEMRDYSHEVFACLFLDNRHRVICFEKLFHGTIDTTQVYPREIVKRVLHHNAQAVILVHNHPSGIAEPSAADLEMTQQIKRALDLIEVSVLDHIIVGDPDSVSLAQRGVV